MSWQSVIKRLQSYPQSESAVMLCNLFRDWGMCPPISISFEDGKLILESVDNSGHMLQIAYGEDGTMLAARLDNKKTKILFSTAGIPKV